MRTNGAAVASRAASNLSMVKVAPEPVIVYALLEVCERLELREVSEDGRGRTRRLKASAQNWGKLAMCSGSHQRRASPFA